MDSSDRVKVLKITDDELDELSMQLLKRSAGRSGIFVMELAAEIVKHLAAAERLPKDTQTVSAWYTPARRSWDVLLRSEQFDEWPQGSSPPELFWDDGHEFRDPQSYPVWVWAVIDASKGGARG